MPCPRVGDNDVGLDVSADLEHEIGDADELATVVGAGGVHRKLVGQSVGVRSEPTL